MGEFKISATLASPVIDPAAWAAPGAVLVGRVVLRRGASVWYNCVLRADVEGAQIEVGEDSNLQDGTLAHVDKDLPCLVGARVTVGHGAILHAAEIGDDCLIGMGTVILSGARIGRGSIVAAGALVPEGMQVPDGTVVAGVPAKVRRETSEADRARMDHAWRIYTGLRDLHRGK
jgi:carbonic anhydrase/acetyltransferase-like protein (isoleucine patch superfamily)